METVIVRDDFVLRCTYCQPTIGLEDLQSIKEHMITRHYTPYILMEQPVELQEKTLKFHRDFYDSVGKYKDEKARRICKCTKFPNKTTRSELYIHSIEAGHYPLVQCSKCHVFMEREDT